MNWDRWLQKRSPGKSKQIFTSKNLYILPTGFGLAYAIVMLSIFTGAINYQVSAAFILTFFLIVIGIIGMWESHKNLSGLSVAFISTQDGEAGKVNTVKVLIKGDSNTHSSLHIQIGKNHPIYIPQIEPTGTIISLPLSTEKRGKFKLPRITIYSYYPFTLFSVWGYCYFDKSYYVYPKAISPPYWPTTSDPSKQTTQIKHLNTSGDELYQLKSIDNPWSQPTKIAWKKVAMGQGWFIKHMTTPQSESYLFSMDMFSNVKLEKCLSYLCYLLINAQQLGYQYGLDIKGSKISISDGETHLKKCLSALASYQ